MVNLDWEASPTYVSERVRIDATCSPVVLYDMKRPRVLEDREIDLMASVAEYHLERGLPFVAIVRQERGTGVITARHRKRFADWLEDRHEAMQRDDFMVIIVVPEAIFRAVLRVVYRFRSPPLRTLTTRDMRGAVEVARSECARLGLSTRAVSAFLDQLD